MSQADLYDVTGPKGKKLLRRASLARVRALLPALVKRFGHVTVSKVTGKPPDDPHKAVRARIVEYAAWAAGRKVSPNIHYAEARPIPAVRPGVFPQLPFRTDCSGFVTQAYQYAGAPDPNGLRYNGQGYTGSLMRRCRKIALAQVKPGDLVIWGPFPGHHVAIVAAAGPNPTVYSNGSESDPSKLKVSAFTDQPGPPVYYTLF